MNVQDLWAQAKQIRNMGREDFSPEEISRRLEISQETVVQTLATFKIVERDRKPAEFKREELTFEGELAQLFGR